jgi:ubiquinone/menaquinone biosynthesis C-methylase UbiE
MQTRWEEINFKPNSILDVGVGTGHPLSTILPNISKRTRILGIDIDKNYIIAAKKLFSKDENV